MNFLKKLFNKNSEQKNETEEKNSDEMEDKNYIENSLLFDADWYKKNYGFGKYLDAANHYLTIGWKENKDPSPYFSTAEYLEKIQIFWEQILILFCILKNMVLKKVVFVRKLKEFCLKF